MKRRATRTRDCGFGPPHHHHTDPRQGRFAVNNSRRVVCPCPGCKNGLLRLNCSGRAA